MKPIVLRSLLAALASTALVIGSALPASAMTPPSPPSGWGLFALDCEAKAATSDQLYAIDTATADATKIGTNNPTDSACALGAAWDAANNTAYYLEWPFDQVIPQRLSSVNLKTGVTTVIGNLHIGSMVTGGNGSNAETMSIAIGQDGKAYALVSYNGSNATLYSLNLADASLTEIAEAPNPLQPAKWIQGFSFDPHDGKFYGIDDAGDLFSINVITGALTFVQTVPGVDSSIESTYSLQIDKNGVLWIQLGRDRTTNQEAIVESLASPTTTDVVTSGVVTLPDGSSRSNVYVQGLLVAPVQPAGPPDDGKLAITGVNGAADAADGLGALGAVLLGVMLLVGVSTRRLRRHSTTGR